MDLHGCKDMAARRAFYGSRTRRVLGWRKMFALLTVLAVAAGGAVQPASAASFAAPQVVEASHRADGGTSIAVQSTGQVHLGYQDTTGEVMKYATNAYGWAPWKTWDVDVVTEGATGSDSCLAVDPAGSIHVCYFDSNLNGIMYATNRSGDWVAYPVEGAVSQHSAIAVGSDNRVHILTINGASEVLYRTADDLSASVMLDDRPGGRVQIAVDGNKVHALYVASGELRYATNATGSWVNYLVETGVSSDSHKALCIDADGNVHAAYAKGTTLRYATKAPGDSAWALPVDVGTGLTDGDAVAVFIAADAGKATIDWFNPTTGEITRIANTSGSWEETWSTALPDAANATNVSIVSTGSNVHLVYTKADTHELMYVTNADADPQGADVQVTQTRSPATVESRQNVEYTVTVTNLGCETATNVELFDDLPAGAVFVSTTQGTYDEAAHKVTWTVASLGKGLTDVTTITVTAPFRGTLVNLATINSTQVQDFRTANNIADDSSSPLSIIPLEHPLVLSVTGNVGGSLTTAQPAQALYDEGSRVPVVATPDPGYQVQGWSGTVDDASTSNGNEVEIGAGGSTTVQVRFEKIPRQLMAVAGGNGSINPLSGIFAHGDVITLTATPKPHYKVKKWTGTDHNDWTGNTNTVTMDMDRTVTVEFELGPNQMPIALASLPAVVCPGDTVVLDGSQSHDPDEDPLTYKWETDQVTLNDSTSVKASFTAPNVEEELIVEVTLAVSDGQLGDTQVYVMKVQPNSPIGGRGCGGGGVNPGGLVCMYSLCWLGLACMKWGPRNGRRGRSD